ncbi:MAG: PAS domain S-box protein, partial [Candidatus Aminicenantaceae bacterium]
KGEIVSVGPPSIDWLGVPLKTRNKIIGVLTIQSYTEGVRYSEEDKNILTFISKQVAMAIERKQTDEALRESEERYKTLYDRSLFGVFVHDLNGKFIDANEAALDLLGYKKEDIPSLNFASLLDESQLLKAFNVLEEIKKTGFQRKPSEYKLKRKEGHYIWVETEASMIYREGKPFAIQGIARDVTERKLIEEELRESEEKFRSMSASAQDGIVMIDSDGNISYWNDAAVSIFGYTKEEAIGKHMRIIIPEEYYDDYQKGFSRFGKTGKGPKVERINEYIAQRKDGMKFPLELSLGSVKIKNQWNAIGIVRDITERKRAEEAIKESEERYRDLVEKAGIAILIDDKKGDFTYFNKKLATLFGYSVKEMEKLSIHSIVHPDNVDMVMKYHRGRITGKKIPSRYEFRGIKKDGSDIYLEVDAVSLKGKGHIIGTRSYMWDITERKKTQEAIQESEEKFKTLFNSASDAIFIHDLGGHFLEVNEVACDRLGYNRKELLRMGLEDIDSPKLATMVPARTEELDQRGHIFYETVHMRRDGTIIPIELSSRIIEYNGEPVALSIARDITERKQAEEERKQSFERLQRALEETVNALASALEMRDPYTAGHQRRVTDLACTIAREMGLSDDQVDGIRMAGIIHDVGKIRVPGEILSWPGQLTEADFNIIKAHPQVGYDILKTIEFPYPVAKIMLQHHERMDGSGYPSGLRDGEILQEARILAVADVVEAMASHRPYRPARGIDKALAEITKNRSVLYDPEVVDACLILFKENKYKFK